MENQAEATWTSQLFKTLLYLENAWKKLEDKNFLVNYSEGWEAKYENDSAMVSFRARPAGVAGPGWLWVGLWIEQGLPRMDRLIWIQKLVNRRGLWENLEAEFKGSDVVIDEDESAFGLPWLLTDDSSNEDIMAAGDELANRIIKVLGQYSPA